MTQPMETDLIEARRYQATNAIELFLSQYGRQVEGLAIVSNEFRLLATGEISKQITAAKSIDEVYKILYLLMDLDVDTITGPDDKLPAFWTAFEEGPLVKITDLTIAFLTTAEERKNR